MIIIYTVPLWLGGLILLLRLFAENSSKRLVDRQITAPDGRQATFRVPFDEPPAVSLARMYPGGVVPPFYPNEVVVPQVSLPRQPMHVAYEEKRPAAMSVHQQWIWIGAGLFLALIAVVSLVNSRNAYYATTVPAAAQPVAQPTPVQTSERAPSSLQRVRLKTGGNIRQGPSTSAGVLRVGQKGELLYKFSETQTGWLQIGSTLIPDGWIAKSVVEPVN